MAGRKRITQLPNTTTPVLTDLTVLVHSGVTYNVALGDLQSLFGSAGSSGSSGTNGTSGSSGVGTSGSSGSSGTSGIIPGIGNNYEVLFRDNTQLYNYNTSTGLTFQEGTLKIIGTSNLLNVIGVNSTGYTNILLVKESTTGDLFSVYSDVDSLLLDIDNDGNHQFYGKLFTVTDSEPQMTAGSWIVSTFPSSSGTSLFMDYVLTSGVTMEAGRVVAVWDVGTSALSYVVTPETTLNGPISGVAISVVYLSGNINVTVTVTTGNWGCKVSSKIM